MKLIKLLVFFHLFFAFLEWNPVYGFIPTDTLAMVVPAIGMDELLVIEDMSPELSLEGRKPLLMIHGWSFEGRPAPPGGGYWDNFRSFLKNDPVLRANFKPYYVKYWSNEVSVQEIAAALRQKVEEAGLHEQKIVIMGHSMGGLVSRSYMNEQTFSKGALKNRPCGDHVDLLITLGSPHHGSPMANGPARNAKVSLFLQMTMNTVESFVFKETKYNQVNRSDLRWDNYDGLFDYQTYSDEKNTWLENLNKETRYDQRTVCYSGSVTGEFIIPENGNVDEQYRLGAWFMQQGFNFTNDGIVPVQSAQFAGHQMKAIRHFNDYNHADIIRGKTDQPALFTPFKNDLLKALPLKITWPGNPSYVKHSQTRDITWQISDQVSSVNLYFSADNGVTFTPIASRVNAAAGKYSWKVPDINAPECQIKIENADFPGEYALSATFTIFHNQISISSPSANEYFVRYRNNLINWTHEGLGAKVKITYTDAVNGIQKIIANETATQKGFNSFTWPADETLPPASQGQIQIQLLELQQNYGDSETYVFSSQAFHLLGDPSISVLTPETSPVDYFGFVGEPLVIGNFYSARWIARGEIKHVELYLCDSLKNVVASLGYDTNSPKAEVLRSTRFNIPELFGNVFYLYLKAGFSKDSIMAEAYSERSFRINRGVNIANPAHQGQDVSIRPCFEVNPVSGANSYVFFVHDLSAESSVPDWQYESTSTGLCVPALIENELEPGKTYRLTAAAQIESYYSFTDEHTFTTAATAPWAFSIVHPQPGDSTELDELVLSWNRAPGARTYRVNLEQNGQNLFTSTPVEATDTSMHLSLAGVEYYRDINLRVVAVNEFGETHAETNFYKKFKTGIDHLEATHEEFRIKNFPNPFTHSTTFEIMVPEAMHGAKLKLTILSMTGEQLTVVADEIARGGLRQISWVNNQLSRGIYTYQLTLGESKYAGLITIGSD